jgi:hypothetical protein
VEWRRNLSGQCSRGSVTPIVGQHYDLRSVSRIEFSHDVPDMHLDGALAHAEFIGDYLVLLALL